jgi:hypothetical protein
MTISLRRWLLVLLAVTALYVGSWAYFAPESWHRTFPGFGHHWLPVLGPYNEHLVKDVGAFYLAFGMLSIVAAWRVRENSLVFLVGAAWLVFNVLHFAYHLQHLHKYSGNDKIFNVVVLVGITLLSAAILLPVRDTQRREPSQLHRG